MIKTKRLKAFDRDWYYKPVKNSSLYWLSKNTITEKQLDEFFDWCLEWCKETFGELEHKEVPYIEWSWNDRWYQSKHILALYDKEDNIIDIRIQGHRTIYNLANTVIHEYIHYLQPTHGNWYERYDKRWGYNKNPYEIEAYRLGGLYAAECVHTVLQWMGRRGRRRKQR